jgi:hypothetical protein
VWVEHVRSIPGLDHDHATGRQVLTKTGQRETDSIERLEISDRTEQAEDRIVPLREMEIAHVALDEPAGRVFPARNADKGRIEIHAVHREAFGRKQPGVLARPAGHVEDGPTPRVGLAQQAGDLRRFAA